MRSKGEGLILGSPPFLSLEPSFIPSPSIHHRLKIAVSEPFREPLVQPFLEDICVGTDFGERETTIKD